MPFGLFVRYARHVVLWVAALVALTGCSTDFVSDDPRAYGLGWGTVGSGEYPTETAAATYPPSAELTSVADVVQIAGDRLYALSPSSGLTVLDVSDPADLRTLGRVELDGEPFAMHVRDGTVYALFSSWRQLADDGSGARPVRSSHVEVLDASTPDAITRLSVIDVPGVLRDTRLKGAILYTVAYESDGCWGCEPGTAVVVRSFDTTDPMAVAPIDAVRVDQAPGTSWKTSFADARVFIPVDAGVRIIDASDPSGQMEFGAIATTAGEPFAMDEFDGALRVGSASEDGSHQLDTFAISTSASVQLLASVPLPDSTQPYDVRFDGHRAYALSNPLVPIDLTDPSAPAVGAALTTPAFILQVEPRGDRLFVLALGSSASNAQLGLWLFDVSAVGTGHLLSTATFGDPEGDVLDWRRGMQIVPESNLVAVPYAGPSPEGACGDSSTTTVQLIDWNADDLVVRGTAVLGGAPWRARALGGRLIAVSDEVATFDLTNRDAPTALDDERIVTAVSLVARAGDWLVRLSTTGSPRIDVVPTSDPERSEPVGALDLGDAIADAFPFACSGGLWLFAHGQRAYVVFSTAVDTRVVVIDLSDPANPTMAGNASLPTWSYPTHLERLVTSAISSVTMVGDQLVLETLEGAPADSGSGATAHGASLTKLDLGAPANPTQMTLQLPSGLGHSGVLQDGDSLFLTHWDKADPGDPESQQVRFYLDRVRVASGVLELLPPINVPGSLVAWDAATKHLLTADYHVAEEPRTPDGCTRVAARDEAHEDGTVTCTYLKRTLVLSELDEGDATVSVIGELDLPEEQLFATPMNGGAFLLGLDAYSTGPNRVHAVSGLGTGALELGTAELPGGRSKVASDGTTLVHLWGGIVTVVDASDVVAMTAAPRAVLSTTYNPQSIDLIGDKLLVSRGILGLDAFGVGP